MSRFRAVFPAVDKPLIAMAHIPALPGTPLYDEKSGLTGAIDHVRQDVAVLVEAGFDAVLFCNETIGRTSSTPVRRARRLCPG